MHHIGGDHCSTQPMMGDPVIRLDVCMSLPDRTGHDANQRSRDTHVKTALLPQSPCILCGGGMLVGIALIEEGAVVKTVQAVTLLGIIAPAFIAAGAVTP